MTNNEIRKDIERRIITCNGVTEAFKSIVNDNIEAIQRQLNVDKSLKNVMYISNMAVSFSISGFKKCGLIKKLYNVVLFEDNEKVVKDEIMEYAIQKANEIIK